MVFPWPQVDDTGKSALDYAREAKQHSTWRMLSQSQQEHLGKSKVQLCFAAVDL